MTAPQGPPTGSGNAPTNDPKKPKKDKASWPRVAANKAKAIFSRDQ